MEELSIVCIDDQREVLTALRDDLENLGPPYIVVECESAAEAEEVLDEIDARGGHVAVLVCDHIMPGQNGVDFLAKISADGRFGRTRKILLTGLASHQDTIEAINRAGLDRYIEKPWERQELLKAVRRLATQYVVQTGLDYKDGMEALDQEVLYEELRRRG